MVIREPDAAASDEAGFAASAPARPIAIDFASTVLIVGGVFRLVAIAFALSAPAEAGFADQAPAIAIIESAIQVLTIAVGLVIRFARGWLFAVNTVAVLAFLQLLSLAGVISLAFAILFSIAFVGIFRSKPWFDAMREHRRRQATGRRA